MNFNDQINELVAKRDVAVNSINDLKDMQSVWKAANGRLKRMQTSFANDDIGVNVTVNDVAYDTFSNALQAIIDSNTSTIIDLQADIDVLSVDVKKYNKAIDTLNALTDSMPQAA